VSKQLYFTENSRDWLSEDVPNDTQPARQSGKDNFDSRIVIEGNLPTRNSAGSLL